MTNQTQEIVYTSESLVLNIPEHVLQMIIIESVVCNQESRSRKKAIFALQLTCKRFYKLFLEDFVWTSICNARFCTALREDAPLLQRPNAKNLFLRSSHLQCDYCSLYPIHIPFKCIHCEDVYLCEQCESEGRHPRDHLLMRLYSPTITDIPVIRRIAKPHQGFCVMCHSPLSEEPIHQCCVCIDYKLCSDCYQRTRHEHRFWKVRIPAERLYPAELLGNNPRGATCDVKGPFCKVLCTGINWKCTLCWGFDVCEACEAEHLHQSSHPLIKIYYCELLSVVGMSHRVQQQQLHEVLQEAHKHLQAADNILRRSGSPDEQP